MKLFFKKISLQQTFNARGFSLIEVTTALLILAIIGTSVLVVVNRAIESVIDSQLKMEAFELARENMENILASSSVKESIEYGISEINPDIEWETAIENFYEPTTNRMWIRARCSVSYFDSKDAEQKVELEHWLTSLSKQQMLQILEQEQRRKAYEMGLMSQDEFEGSGEVDIELLYAQSLIGQEISYVKEDGSIGTMVVEDVEIVDGEIVMNPGEDSVPLEAVPDIETKLDDYEEKHPELVEEDIDTKPESDEYADPYEAILGPVPDGYDSWYDVPFNLVWKRYMEIDNSK